MQFMYEYCYYLRRGDETYLLGSISAPFIFRTDYLFKEILRKERLNLREIKRVVLEEKGILFCKRGEEQTILADLTSRSRGKVLGLKSILRLLGVDQKLFISSSLLLFWLSWQEL